MSRSNRNRQVTPGVLETPEAGAPPLETPEGDEELLEREDEVAATAPAPPDPARPSSDDVRRQRIAIARALAPNASHWRSAWLAGRDAAISAIEAGESLVQVRARQPPEGAGCRDCWARGHAAALRVIEAA